MRFHVPVALSKPTWILTGMRHHTVITLINAIKVRLAQPALNYDNETSDQLTGPECSRLENPDWFSN